MIGEILQDTGKNISNLEKKATKFGEEAYEKLSEIPILGQHLAEQGRGLSESFEFDTREPILGEARAIHPNQFVQFTTAPVLGVTKLPIHGAKGILYLAKHRQQIQRLWKTAMNLQKPNLKNIKSSLSGKNLKNPLPKTTNQLKKSPRVLGTLTGTMLATLLMSGYQTQQNLLQNGEWVPKEEKITYRRYLS